MKIAINATIFNNFQSGAKRRFVGLFEKVFEQLQDCTFYIYEPKDCSVSNFFHKKYNNVIFKRTKLLSDRPFQRFIVGIFFWKKELNIIKPDIFETFTLPMIKSPAGKTILTIHDIRYVQFPKFYSFFRRIIIKFLMYKALNHAEKIIVVSNSVKIEINKFFPGKNIDVIYNPLLNIFDQPRVNKTKINLPNNYILCVGIIEKRKNYINLIRAVNLVVNLGYKINIVIVGSPADDYKNLLSEIDYFQLMNNIRILKNISDYELKSCYINALGFIFQSFYEGFGIPIIEALSVNCAIALSDISVFRELTENKCRYFNPNDIEQIATCLIEIINNRNKYLISEKDRKSLLDKFTMEAQSKKLINIYKTIM